MYSNTLVFAAAAITSLGAVALFSAPASAQYYGGGYCAYHPHDRSAWQVSWRPTCIITTTNTMTIIMIITTMITIIMTMTMTTIITTKTGGPSLIS